MLSHVLNWFSGDKKENDEVDLEVYPNSPRKFSKGLSSFLLKNDREPPETMQIDNIKFDMNPIPDVLTTRACVEVDIGLPRSPRLDVRPEKEPQACQSDPSLPQVVPKVCHHLLLLFTNNTDCKNRAQIVHRNVFWFQVEPIPHVTQKNDTLPTILETEDPEAEDKDVLDRITHDLDYLLGRSAEDGQAQYPQPQRPKKHVTICDSKGSPSSGYAKTVLWTVNVGTPSVLSVQR